MSDDPFSPSVHEALSLAVAAGAGGLAAAAAERTSVPDTLSALLGHELAVGHRLMMRLAAEVDGIIGGIAAARPEDRTALEAARLTGVVARLMERYRVGVMALHKLRGKSGLGETIVRLRWGTADDEPKDSGSGAGGADGGGQAAGGGSGAACAPADPAGTVAAAPAARGRLRNGNPAGDYAAAPRCGARTRAGQACRQPAMANGRCRLHGGLSRGPVTAEGRARSRRARLRHGGRTAGVIAMRAAAAASGRRLAALLDAAGRAAPAGHGVDRSDSPSPRSPAGRSGGRPRLRLGHAEPRRDPRDAPVHPVDPVGEDGVPAEQARELALHQADTLLELLQVGGHAVDPDPDVAEVLKHRIFGLAGHAAAYPAAPMQSHRGSQAFERAAPAGPSGGAQDRMAAPPGHQPHGRHRLLGSAGWSAVRHDLPPPRPPTHRPSPPPAR